MALDMLGMNAHDVPREAWRARAWERVWRDHETTQVNSRSPRAQGDAKIHIRRVNTHARRKGRHRSEARGQERLATTFVGFLSRLGEPLLWSAPRSLRARHIHSCIDDDTYYRLIISFVYRGPRLPVLASMPLAASRSSGPCRSCGHQIDVYKERMMEILRENKALLAENRRLKAEVRASA
jgi:hypothetical protein